MCNGTALPGLDVTVPDNADALDGIAVFYSLIPWILAVVLLIGCIVKRTILAMCTVFLGATMIIINEGIVKRIVRQPRPAGSCLHSLGMPSSHSMISVGFCCWLWLECAFHKRDVPFFPGKAILVVVSGILLLPVPASRVRLQDHSELQVGVGSAEGIFFALLWFLLFHFLFAPKGIFDIIVESRVGQFLGMRNDYGYPWPPPEKEVQIGADQPRDAVAEGDDVEELKESTQ